MSKKGKDFVKYRQFFANDTDDTSSIIKNLESAWNNLSDDFYQDERTFFIELVEKVAKMKSLSAKNPSEDMSKN